MTLEEADKQFTLEYRTAINTVGGNEIAVKKRLPNTGEKLYAVYYAREPREPFAFDCPRDAQRDNNKQGV